MKFLIHFLFILSIIIATADSIPSKSEMEEIIKGDQSKITGSPDNNLKLLTRGELLRTPTKVFWKGTYNDFTEVAIKIFAEEDSFEYELYVLERLNATNNPTIEDKRIPRVYYHGPILGAYFAIAMSSFDETLANRFHEVGSVFSDPTILLIFKHVTQALQYIHGKNVAHNEINLNNIFIRGQDVFIANFDKSRLDECEMLEDDYEALQMWTWHMVGFPIEANFEPHSPEFLNFIKLRRFKNPNVKDAFQSILRIDHIRMENDLSAFLPNYKKIIETADAALGIISMVLGPVQFDWVDKRKSPPSGESASHTKVQRIDAD